MKSAVSDYYEEKTFEYNGETWRYLAIQFINPFVPGDPEHVVRVFSPDNSVCGQAKLFDRPVGAKLRRVCETIAEAILNTPEDEVIRFTDEDFDE